MGGKSRAPESPNYEAIVRQQGIENRETARFNNELGKVNTGSGPYGYTYWQGNTLNSVMSPSELTKYYQQNNLSDLGYQRSRQMLDSLGGGLNFAGAPSQVTSLDPYTGDAARQRAIDAVYSQYTSKLDPMYRRQQTDLETSLINKGFDPNSAAYQEQQANLSRNQADAYQQALNAAVLQGNETQNQAFQQAAQAGAFQNQARDQYVNEVMSKYNQNWADFQNFRNLMQGPQMPQPMSGNQGSAAPADLMGGAQQGYQAALNQANARNANSASTWGTIGALGSMAAMFFSDERLKDNFEPVGQTTEGVPVWEYDIQGRRERGVIAQQVQQLKPEAVKEHPSGFLMVDYSQVGKF